MPRRRWLRPERAGRSAGRTFIVLLALLIAVAAIAAVLVFRSLVTELASSSAKEAVIAAVNGIVRDIMLAGDAPPQLVTLEKDAQGAVTAITTNVAEVNALAAEIMELAVARTAHDTVRIDIPVGSLFKNALLMNRGPAIPVEVAMLSSSVAGFRSELTGAGINQTRHQILMDINVSLSLLLPWRTVADGLNTEILVSETVIVGRVPESYMNWENQTNGRTEKGIR